MARFNVILGMSLCLLAGLAYAQHDPGRNAVRMLVRGDLDGGVRELGQQPRNSAISDADRHYVLAMAACLGGDADAALREARAALENGLPLVRLLAGPRGVFAPLYAHPGFEALIGEDPPVLLHGPLVGSVTNRSARFWVRTYGACQVAVQAGPAVGPEPMLRSEIVDSVEENDFTAVIALEGLQPDMEYAYEVFIEGARVHHGATFRTHPAQGEAARFRIAFGGGAGYTPEHERMWTTIAGLAPQALLLLGDNVYIDDPEYMETNHYCYYRRQSEPLWRALTATTAVYTIYDDHDFGLNDCVPGPHIEAPPWKRKVWEVFGQNWANPSYGGGAAQPGCWYDFHIGDVHFIMLDGRYYRDLEGGSMLGPVQKAWLFDTLRNSRGTFKVLASPVPWSPGVKPGSRDTWDGFKEEREEIFGFIAEHAIDGVLLMAADRHRSDLRRTPRADGYDLYEVMSSRLTNVHTHGLVENAEGSEFIFGYNEKCSVGVLDFDTKANPPRVEYRIVNIDGEEIHRRALTLAELSHSAP